MLIDVLTCIGVIIFGIVVMMIIGYFMDNGSGSGEA